MLSLAKGDYKLSQHSQPGSDLSWNYNAPNSNTNAPIYGQYEFETFLRVCQSMKKN